MTNLVSLSDLQELIEKVAAKQNELLKDPNKDYGSPTVVAFNNIFWSIQKAYESLEKGYKGEYFHD